MSEYKYYIKQIYQPVPDLVILELVDKRGWPVFHYQPGQYAMIAYKNRQGIFEDKHAFSIASSPTRKDCLRFGIRIQGPFTQGLARLRPGDEILVSGPYGRFFYDENKYFDLVLIAGGIGITPFISALNYAVDLNLSNKLSLIYSAKTARGAVFYKEIKEAIKGNPNLSALFSFTEEKGPADDKNVLYRRIDASLIQDFVGNVKGKSFFLCGPVPFMNAMVSHLMSLGVDKDQIRMEEFSMIPDDAFWPRLKNFSYALGLAIVLFVLIFNLISRSAAIAASKKYSAVSFDQTKPSAVASSAAPIIEKKISPKKIPAIKPAVPAPTIAPTPVQAPPQTMMQIPMPRTRMS